MANDSQRIQPEAWTDASGSLQMLPKRFKESLDGQFSDVDVDEKKSRRHHQTKKFLEQGIMLHVRPDPVDQRDRYYDPRLVALKPFHFPRDLRRLGLAVRNQGAEGSCTGQALAATIDLQNIERLRRGADVPSRVSARMLYENARLFDEFPEDDLPGSSVRGALKGFYHHGVCSSKLAPYDPTLGREPWQLTVEQSKEARNVCLGAYFRLQHILNHYHAALNESQAILCSAMIHDGWLPENVTSKNGRIFMDKDAERIPLSGAHAFAIVGYDQDGFLVLNSWGRRWGNFDPYQAFNEKRAGGPNGDLPVIDPPENVGNLPGVAHWSYEDWQAHVLDAWVFRLTAPTRRWSGYSGGYLRTANPGATVVSHGSGNDAEDLDVKPLPVPSTPQVHVQGHLIHLRNGQLMQGHPYATPLSNFHETARFLTENENADEDNRYNHLLFFAHGGLNDLKDSVSRAAMMTEVFKRHGIFPVFYVWRTGFGDVAGDLLQRLFERVILRSGSSMSEFRDRLLEKVIQPFGRPMWSEMKNDARLSFLKQQEHEHFDNYDLSPVIHPQASFGDGWKVTEILLNAAKKRKKHEMKVHFVGHSAGAIFLGEMYRRAEQENYDFSGLGDTTSLLAPACTTKYLNEHFIGDKQTPGALQKKRIKRLDIYNLTDDLEQSDTVARLYKKSLLYLVSNAFEAEHHACIAGMDEYASQKDDCGINKHPNVEYTTSEHGSKRKIGKNQHIKTTASSHGDFDNDATTMNSMLARVLGKSKGRIDEKDGGFSQAQLSSGHF